MYGQFNIAIPLGSHGEETLGPPSVHQLVQHPNGLAYGNEFTRDAFDQYADELLLAKAAKEGSSNNLRTALDIGCWSGHRAESLARLGIFDQLFISDLVKQGDFAAVGNELFRRGKSSSSITFVQKNVINLEPSDFGNILFDYINFRNVAHFLSPQHFRKALENIARLAAQGALVTISFDGKPKPATPRNHIMKDRILFYSWFNRINKYYGAYTRYDSKSVREFMGLQGFTLLPEENYLFSNRTREAECRIAALAPGPQAARFG